jgi:hypothetical protein
MRYPLRHRDIYTQQTKKKSDTFSICACHPCAGAILLYRSNFIVWDGFYTARYFTTKPETNSKVSHMSIQHFRSLSLPEQIHTSRTSLLVKLPRLYTQQDTLYTDTHKQTKVTRRRWIRTTGTLIPHGFEVQALNPQSSSTQNAGCEDRTHDLWIMRPTLYRLSQPSMCMGWCCAWLIHESICGRVVKAPDSSSGPRLRAWVRTSPDVSFVLFHDYCQKRIGAEV